MNYVVMARKAGDHFFLGDASQTVKVGDWRTGAIFGQCRRIELAMNGGIDLMKFIGMDVEQRTYIRALLKALLETGSVNIGLTDEGSDGQLRFMICFPDEGTLKARMTAAEGLLAKA